MPLTAYTCQIAGGCNLFVPNSNASSPYGATGSNAVGLGVQLAIPAMNVAPGANPGNGAIRVVQGGVTRFIWASGGNVHWVSGNALGNQFAGPAAAGSRAFNLWAAGGGVQFAVV
ncbi:MAG TPA: hypothetical protein VGO40_17285 [Longimicrobium sp.]|jgi:hypothetical protein|nr:hypothetical protein [Longimicrobium sp.]